MRRDINCRVALVISKGNVVTRPVPFDELTLEEKGFSFTVRDSNINGMNPGHHCLLFG